MSKVRYEIRKNELQEEREGNKGEIEYATFSNYDAANEIRAIKSLRWTNATLHNENRVERKQSTKGKTIVQKTYREREK
jgi:hypothetical protein